MGAATGLAAVPAGALGTAPAALIPAPALAAWPPLSGVPSAPTAAPIAGAGTAGWGLAMRRKRRSRAAAASLASTLRPLCSMTGMPGATFRFGPSLRLVLPDPKAPPGAGALPPLLPDWVAEAAAAWFSAAPSLRGAAAAPAAGAELAAGVGRALAGAAFLAAAFLGVSQPSDEPQPDCAAALEPSAPTNNKDNKVRFISKAKGSGMVMGNSTRPG